MTTPTTTHEAFHDAMDRAYRAGLHDLNNANWIDSWPDADERRELNDNFNEGQRERYEGEEW